MTEEQIKQTSKIAEFARNMVKQSNYPKDLQDHIIATCMVVATEATKELESQIKKMHCCENCKFRNEYHDADWKNEKCISCCPKNDNWECIE